MKLYFTVLFVLITFSQVWFSEGSSCERRRSLSGEISTSSLRSSSKCWIIEVPPGSYTRMEITYLSASSCSYTYLQITIDGTGEKLTYCSPDSTRKPISSLSDVNVTAVSTHYSYLISVTMNYTTESLVCGQKNHFRCSKHSCIPRYQVCDGVKHCDNGADEIGCEIGISAVKGVSTSRAGALRWLKNKRSRVFGWGQNTHRAVTALFLAGDYVYNGKSLEEELVAKQLELQTSVALLRNSTNPFSVNELSLFINALLVTCHNPRDFYGYDLLQILSDRVSSSKSVIPVAYLTLCNANWTISDSQTSNLVRLMQSLQKDSQYPFQLDFQAMTIMALTCIKNKAKEFDKVTNATEVYNSSMSNFISNQLPDGSFGNSYTTALVTQALVAGRQDQNRKWNVNSTVLYLMNQLNSTSVDVLLTYLTLPILNSKSLVDVGAVDCSKNPRIQGKDNEILDLLKKLGGKMRVQFSLYVGDEKDVIHTLYLRVPDNSTAYDVMKIAQVADVKYQFLQKDLNNHIYIYEINGIANDPEIGMFWLLYTADLVYKDKLHHHTQSPDNYTLKNNEHLIMWYKTVDA